MWQKIPTEDPGNKLMIPTSRCGDDASEGQRDAMGIHGKGLVRTLMLTAPERCGGKERCYSQIRH